TERPLLRLEELAPDVLRRRLQERRRDELVLRVQVRAALRADGADEDAQEFESARDLPAAEVAGRRVAPDVRRERAAGRADLARDGDDRLLRDAALRFGGFGRELRV